MQISVFISYNKFIYHNICTLLFFVLTVPPDKDITEEEETINRKIKPKPRYPQKQSVGHEATTITKTTTDFQTSKYFQSSGKEKQIDSEDDFDIGRSAALPAGVNKKKVEKDAEAEEDSDEDEDDWEEVEGRSHISFSCWSCAACNQGINR